MVIDMPHGELLCEKAMHSIANLSTGCIARDVGGPFVHESLCSAKLCNRLRATWRGCPSKMEAVVLSRLSGLEPLSEIGRFR